VSAGVLEARASRGTTGERARQRAVPQQPHFERHVESRDASGELNPTEVVEGIPARRDQFEDAIEPPRGAWISSVARGRSPKRRDQRSTRMNSLS